MHPEILGRVERGGFYDGDRLRPHMDGLSDDSVNMTLFYKVDGVLVVRAEQAPCSIRLIEKMHQSLQVSGGSSLPDHNIRPRSNFAMAS